MMYRSPAAKRKPPTKDGRLKRCGWRNRHPASARVARVTTGETYFQKVELTDRQPLYVSRTTHEKLMRIVTVIGGRKVTVSSYVENILLRHFEQYQDEINTLYESNFQKPV